MSQYSQRSNEITKLPLIIFLMVMFSCIGYIGLTYSHFGLIFWEIAGYIIFLLWGPTIWIIIRMIRTQNNALTGIPQKIQAIFLVFFIGVQIWAIYPGIMAPSVATEFDSKMIAALGENYLQNVPDSIQDLLKEKPFTWREYWKQNDTLPYNLTEDVAYDSFNYTVMDIYQPLDFSGLRPCLIIVHGGASTKSIDHKGSGEENVARWFTRLGFVAISIDYASSIEGKMPQQILNVRTALAYIHDHAAEYSINTSLICMFGRSRGGQMVALAALSSHANANEYNWYQTHAGNFTLEQLSVRAVVDLYGTVNPDKTAFWGNSFLVKRNLEVFGGTVEELPEVYGNCSASHLVTENAPHTFIMHGKIDGMVDVEESIDFYNHLQDAGVTSIYLEIPTGQHGFDAFPSTYNAQLMYYYVERFLVYEVYGR